MIKKDKRIIGYKIPINGDNLKMEREVSKFVGVTLLFSYLSNGRIEGEKRDYVYPYKNYADLIRKIEGEREKRELRYKEDRCLYHGIYDCFHVLGPFTEGAILGLETWRSLNSVHRARKLLKQQNSFGVYGFTKPPGADYVVQAVYFIRGSSHKTNYAAKILVKVDGANVLKSLMKNLDGLLGAKKYISKIKRFLIGCKKDVHNIEFIGIADVQFSPQRIKAGACFSASYKMLGSRSCLNKLALKQSEIRTKLSKEY